MTRRAWVVAALLTVAVGVVILLSWWDWKTLIGWRALVDYIDPEDATGRKDAVQVYAVIVAGMVAAITAAVGLANLRFTRKNLEQQRELEVDRAREQRELEQRYAPELMDPDERLELRERIARLRKKLAATTAAAR